MDVLWTPPKAKADPNIRTAYMSDVSVEDASGQVLCKRFELLAPIGFGATAAVYRAFDRDTKSEVAVKILYKSLRADAEALRYFDQEGKLAARIVHPHLLRAHYYGQRRGAPFIVFELVPGTSLSQVAAMRPLPWRRLAVIVLQVLDALAKLHDEGVIHGDIQPENVIVQQTTLGQDFAKVIDLGFASARGCSRLTLAAEPPAEVHGTPGFIAPERLAGLDPDARADLYSVGALMYFLLTTRPVPDISLAPEELGVPSPSVMAPGARIPHTIDVIVMRALSDVDDRFPTAADMARALREALTQSDLPAVVAVPEATLAATAPFIPSAAIEVPQDPPAAISVAVAAEHTPEPLGSLGVMTQQAATRTPIAVGWASAWPCVGSSSRRCGTSVPHRAVGTRVADQAMNLASTAGSETASIRHPAPAPAPPNLLPPAPPEPKSTPVVPKGSSASRPTAADPRVSEVRGAINRCNPLVPYSRSTITVKADQRGNTLILFGQHEARGQLGLCVAKIAARTKIAKGERLTFKLSSLVRSPPPTSIEVSCRPPDGVATAFAFSPSWRSRVTRRARPPRGVTPCRRRRRRASRRGPPSPVRITSAAHR
jgi:serine/threonine protein kinase